MEQQPQTFFLIGAVTAYFTIFALQILNRKNRTHLQTVLGWCLVFWAILNAKDMIRAFPGFDTRDTMNTLIIIDGWSTVTYILFIMELTIPNWVTWRRIILLCIPFAVFSAVYWLWPDYVLLNIYVIFLWICAAVFFITGFITSRRYIRYIHENYSNIDEIDISWLKYVFVFAILEQSTYFVMSARYNIFVELIYYISAIGIWQLAIKYSKELQPVMLQELDSEVAGSRSYPFAGNVEELVEGKLMYLNKDLTLSDLAKCVGTNRTYLSDYFCNHKHTTFYDYVNQLRIVEMAVPLIQQHPEYTVEYIASESGFKHVTTFRRAFTKFMGMSPSQFRSEKGLG